MDFFFVDSVIILYFFALFIFIINEYTNIKKEIYIILFESKIRGNPIKKKQKKVKPKNRKRKINIFHKKNDSKLYSSKNSKTNLEISNKKLANIKEKYNKDLSKFNSCNKLKIKERINIDRKKKYNSKTIILKDIELNTLDYDEAFRIDHRNYCQYYYSLLKKNHPILFSFCYNNDYNSRIIKIP